MFEPSPIVALIWDLMDIGSNLPVSYMECIIYVYEIGGCELIATIKIVVGCLDKPIIKNFSFEIWFNKIIFSNP